MIGEEPLLLILLDERKGELEASLTATSPFERPLESPPAALAFKTELREARSVLAGSAKVRGGTSRSRETGGLALELLFQPCFVVPLRKREGSTSLFAERVTVGRARNHDIVLRHPSVSKFHAWFERDGAGGFTVGDAGSSNHTYVNGMQVRQSPVVLRAGSHLKFGSVEAVYTTFDALWDLVSGPE